MRILFFSNVYPNPLNPAKGTFNRSLIRALAKKHGVHVVSPIAWTDELKARVLYGKRLGLEPVELADEIPVEYPQFRFPPKILRHRYGQFLWRSVKPVLQETVERFQPEAVLSYWAHPDGEVGIRIARSVGIPAVVMVGGSDVLVLARHGKRRAAIRNVLCQSDAVVAVSRNIADCISKEGVPAEKVHVIRRGVDRGLFFPGDQAVSRKRLGLDPDRPVLVSAGRLVPVKGFPILIEACRILTQRRVALACYVLGGGPQAASLQRKINRAGLCNVCRLGGPQHQSALADWYRAADLMVLPSFSEGVPNVLLESSACGTAFVASDVGGVREIFDPRLDRLVPPGDPRALADALEAQLSAGRSRGPRRFVSKSWDESADSLACLLDALRHSFGTSRRLTFHDEKYEPDEYHEPVVRT